MRQSLILWDAEAHTASVQEILQPPPVRVTSEEGLLHSLFPTDDIASVIILAELGWDGRRRSEFVGVDVLCELRFGYGVRCPIAVCSFMPERALRSRFPVLKFAKNHPFIRLPAKRTEFMETLHVAEFADDARMHHILQYCDPFGRVERLITHGVGFSALHQCVGDATLSDSVWCALEEDSVLLSKYLNTVALGSSATEAGGALLRGLQAAIRSRHNNMLEEVRSLLATFQLAMRSARS